MHPLLEDSDEVLVDPRAPGRPGDVVVARHPFRRGMHLIKRLEAFDEQGHARLVGLNASESTEELKQDAEIAELHGAAVSWHRARRDTLLSQPEFRAMRAQLRGADALPPQERALIERLGLTP